MTSVDPTSVYLVLVSVSGEPEAIALSRTLVEEQHVACGTVLPGGTSVYRWEGKVQEAQEALVLLKCSGAVLDPLLARVKELHSYEVPEILVLPVAGGHAPYLAWVLESCVSSQS